MPHIPGAILAAIQVLSDARFDILVHPEEVSRIIFVLKGDESVVVRTIRGRPLLSFIAQIIYYTAPVVNERTAFQNLLVHAREGSASEDCRQYASNQSS